MILEFTNPIHDGQWTYLPDIDRWTWACEESPNPCTDLAVVNLYRYPYIGGNGTPTKVRSKSVAGRQGQIDTLQVSDFGVYFVTFSDSTGNESCSSNGVTFAPTTGVESSPAPFIVRSRVFNVHGQLIGNQVNPPNGIYFLREEWSDGRVTKRKIAVLHRKEQR